MVYIGHMLDMARKAMEKVQGKSREDFDEDENLRMAIALLIQVIGEAARRVSPVFQQETSHIPWKKITGMRHKLVHDYMHVNYDIVWDVVNVELPRLAQELEALFQDT